MRYGLLLLLLGLTSVAQAFDARGHALVCQMAYDQLSREIQARIDALIVKSPEKSFATACAWPDKARDLKEYQHTRTWHFVNVERDALQVKPADCPASGCLLSAIPQMQLRLRDNPGNDWGALLFLSHFIADLHQPMHVSYFDDRGGNRTAITFNGKKMNLHHLWDGELLGNYQWRAKSQELNALISAEQKQAWAEGDLYQWANESLAITRNIYERMPKSKKWGENEQDYFAPQLQLQMQKASVRLAKMLNDAL